jgi:hypothetical protein
LPNFWASLVYFSLSEQEATVPSSQVWPRSVLRQMATFCLARDLPPENVIRSPIRDGSGTDPELQIFFKDYSV